MGDFGIAGLWLLLAFALVGSVLVAAGSMWLADRTLPKPVSEGHNGALSVDRAAFRRCRTAGARLHAPGKRTRASIAFERGRRPAAHLTLQPLPMLWQ
jgi:hypothetical protein